MVERLKVAIEKAREKRSAIDGGAPTGVSVIGTPPQWSDLPELTLDPLGLKRQRIVSYGRTDPAHVSFDVLRTRLLRAANDHNWGRIGVMSATNACGKSVVTLNLAFSLARHPGCRVLVCDFDLRSPSLARYLGIRWEGRFAEFLAGREAYQDHFRRLGHHMAVGLNGAPVNDASELIQSVAADATLRDTIRTLSPTITLFDMPPLLAGDDSIGFLPNLDAVLLVAAAGQTTAAQLLECERLLGDNTALLGVVLNKSKQTADAAYQYESGS